MVDPFNIDMRTGLAFLSIGNIAGAALIHAYFLGKSIYTLDVDTPALVRRLLAARYFLAAGWFLLGLRGVVPDALSVMVGNAAVFSGLGFELLSIITAIRHDPGRRSAVAVVTAAIVTVLVINNLPSNLRVASASGIVCAIYAAATASLLWRPVEHSSLQRLLAYSYLTLSIALALRAISASSSPSEFNILSSGAEQSLWILIQYFLLLTGGFGLLLLLKKRETDKTLDYERQLRDEQGRFLSMLSHEIRTPLAIIDISVQSLGLLDDDADERRIRYDRIRRAAERMNILFKTCLTRERISTGEFQLNRRPVDLMTLTSNMIDSLDPNAQGRIILSSVSNRPMALADDAILTIALMNLLENSVKYSNEGTSIHIDIYVSQKFVVWQITDQGPGLPPGVEERMFDKYQRGDDASGHPGLGLGLYLARHIITLHGGTLTAERPHSGGARFVCCLPPHDRNTSE